MVIPQGFPSWTVVAWQDLSDPDFPFRYYASDTIERVEKSPTTAVWSIYPKPGMEPTSEKRFPCIATVNEIGNSYNATCAWSERNQRWTIRVADLEGKQVPHNWTFMCWDMSNYLHRL